MKKLISNSRGGETYTTPTLDILNVQVEQGFALSPNPDNYGGTGDPGDILNDNIYNEDF